MVLPEKVLNEIDLEELPILDSDRSTLFGALHDRPKRVEEFNQQFPKRPITICYPLPERQDQKVAEGPPTDFKAIFQKSELVVRGGVTATVAGWSTWVRRVVTMVYVRVEEVLNSPKSGVRVGDVVIYEEDHGSIQVHGAPICTDGPPGLYGTAVGDELLIAAAHWENDPDLLILPYVFPMENRKVSSKAFVPVGKAPSVALEDLRQLAREGGVK
jgi:hypothetical protein